jgi:hypothetical protein
VTAAACNTAGATMRHASYQTLEAAAAQLPPQNMHANIAGAMVPGTSRPKGSYVAIGAVDQDLERRPECRKGRSLILRMAYVRILWVACCC